MFFGKRSEEEDDGSRTQRKIFFVNMLRKSLAPCRSQALSHPWTQVREGVLIKKNRSMITTEMMIFMIMEKRMVMMKTLRVMKKNLTYLHV